MKNAYIISIIAALLFAAGCSSDNSTSPTNPNNNSTTGHLTLRLTDAPGAYQQVNITFTQIDVNHDSGWVSMLLDSALTVNLLEWNNGQSIVLGEKDLPPGNVKEVRLIIDRASIMVDSVLYPMDVPSGSSSGLKIKTDLDIVSGGSYVLVIDFDAQKSIVTTGPPSNPKGYKLNPVIRAVPMGVAGSISGTVSNPDAYATATAKDSTGTGIATAVADSVTGAFTIGFLPAGTYSVDIADTLGRTYTASGVVVDAGKNTDIGTVTLN